MNIYKNVATGAEFYAAQAADADQEFMEYAEKFYVSLCRQQIYNSASGQWGATETVFCYDDTTAVAADWLLLPRDKNILLLYGTNTYRVVSDYLFNKSYKKLETENEQPQSPEANTLAGRSFYLDAGHGGKDPGAVNNNLGLQEKIAALDVCLKLGMDLEAMGANVYFSRSDNDSYPALSARASAANGLNVTAFISIHLNSAESKAASGIETLVYSTKGTAFQLAGIVQENMIKATGFRDRGIKERPELTVLKKTYMPAILCEIGFISNDDEAKKLFQPNVQDALAEAICSGIVEVFGKSE